MQRGEVLEANEGFRPSSEVKMHMRIYEKRPDVKAVVHATSHVCHFFCNRRKTINGSDHAGGSDFSGAVCRLQSTERQGRWRFGFDRGIFGMTMMRYFWKTMGPLTYSDSLLNAYYKMESVEFYARLMYQAQMLGGAKIIPPEKVEELYETRRRMNVVGRHPAVK